MIKLLLQMFSVNPSSHCVQFPRFKYCKASFTRKLHKLHPGLRPTWPPNFENEKEKPNFEICKEKSGRWPL